MEHNAQNATMRLWLGNKNIANKNKEQCLKTLWRKTRNSAYERVEEVIKKVKRGFKISSWSIPKIIWRSMIHEYDVGEMVEHNIEQTTNDSLNLGNTEMKKVYFYGSKKCIDVFDVHIKKKKRIWCICIWQKRRNRCKILYLLRFPKQLDIKMHTKKTTLWSL